MDAAGSCVNAVVAAIQSEQLPVCGSGIADEYRTLESASNLEDMDGGAVATSLPREPINHESQIFVQTCNRTIILNVNLASDSVEEMKRLIEEREGIPVSEQHLIFGGKPLRHGTFLRDYDALGDESTLNVFARIRGGNRTRDMTLRHLVDRHPSEVLLRRKQSIPMLPEPPVDVQVLTEVGGRILYGVLTCILSAHIAGLSFDGACGMDDLMVHVYEGATEEKIVVSRVYVRDRRDDDGLSSSLVTLDRESQKKDYNALKEVFLKLFHDDDSRKTLHIGNIWKLLNNFAQDNPVTKDFDPVERTHLLQAYAAMVSSPVAVSTMCLNLKRFYDQLDGNRKPIFADAMRAAQYTTRLLCEEVGKQSLFKNVYERPPSNQNNNSSSGSGNVGGNLPDNPYDGGRTGMGLFYFARNWFAHVPEERWPRGGTEKFEGLPHLDCIFTYHFPDFIPQALLQLYKKFGDHDLLTKVLVPLA